VVIVRLGLPWWWLLFPPLAEGLWSGNPGIVVLALVLSGRWWLEALAPPLKLYGGIPLAAQVRWRSLAAAAAMVGATMVLAPDLWRVYLVNFTAISDRLLAESAGGFGANAWPVLLVAVIVAVGALALLDRAPPAGWPCQRSGRRSFLNLATGRPMDGHASWLSMRAACRRDWSARSGSRGLAGWVASR
jgi:hypothetical protein